MTPTKRENEILRRALGMAAYVIVGVCYEDEIMHHCPGTKCGATKAECIRKVTEELSRKAKEATK